MSRRSARCSERAQHVAPQHLDHAIHSPRRDSFFLSAQQLQGEPRPLAPLGVRLVTSGIAMPVTFAEASALSPVGSPETLAFTAETFTALVPANAARGDFAAILQNLQSLPIVANVEEVHGQDAGIVKAPVSGDTTVPSDLPQFKVDIALPAQDITTPIRLGDQHPQAAGSEPTGNEFAPLLPVLANPQSVSDGLPIETSESLPREPAAANDQLQAAFPDDKPALPAFLAARLPASPVIAESLEPTQPIIAVRAADADDALDENQNAPFCIALQPPVVPHVPETPTQPAPTLIPQQAAPTAHVPVAVGSAGIGKSVPRLPLPAGVSAERLTAIQRSQQASRPAANVVADALPGDQPLPQAAVIAPESENAPAAAVLNEPLPEHVDVSAPASELQQAVPSTEVVPSEQPLSAEATIAELPALPASAPVDERIMSHVDMQSSVDAVAIPVTAEVVERVDTAVIESTVQPTAPAETHPKHTAPFRSMNRVQAREGRRPAAENPATAPAIELATESIDAVTDIETRIDTLDPAQQVVEAVLSRVEVSTENSTDRYEFRLDPPDLGEVVVEFQRTAQGEVSVRVSAAHPATQALLEQHAGRIENSLQDQGLDLSRFDFGSQSSADGRSQQDDPSARPNVAEWLAGRVPTSKSTPVNTNTSQRDSSIRYRA